MYTFELKSVISNAIYLNTSMKYLTNMTSYMVTSLSLNLYLLGAILSSADHFCKQFVRKLDRPRCPAWVASKLFNTLAIHEIVIF